MRPTQTRSRKGPSESSELLESLQQRVVGQTEPLAGIVPYIEMYQAGLAPEGRPAGVFLLLGPTGTGKTRTVEALASVLHGSERNVLRIDCGEFQMEHEVAKLIGAPPGYLGHRETTPMLNQQKLNAVTSEQSNLSIVLFDEIEKAAASLSRLLLGVLDKATLRLGDNTVVNFERSLIFLTSNLGARGMSREMRPSFGFEAVMDRPEPAGLREKLQRIALSAVKRRFSPEFVNRIDVVSTYLPLDRGSIEAILEQQVKDFQRHLNQRLGNRTFTVELSAAGREFLIQRGTSPECGARELKRTLHRFLMQPVAALVARGAVPPFALVEGDHQRGEQQLTLKVLAATGRAA